MGVARLDALGPRVHRGDCARGHGRARPPAGVRRKEATHLKLRLAHEDAADGLRGGASGRWLRYSLVALSLLSAKNVASGMTKVLTVSAASPPGVILRSKIGASANTGGAPT